MPCWGLANGLVRSEPIDAPPAENLEAIAKSLGRHVEDLVVVVLDRPRHAALIEQIRATGARIRQVPFTPERVKAALDAR